MNFGLLFTANPDWAGPTPAVVAGNTPEVITIDRQFGRIVKNYAARVA